MHKFMTPCDDDDTKFIECKVCEKSIRGETLFKIHLTSPGHLKKEDALVAVGQAVRRRHIPVFEDILHYLDYMKLDEPIIGLNYLREVPNKDPQGDPSYNCSLCGQTAHLTEMVHHLIGRKHRQNYVEMERPELVTWSKRESPGGKHFKAKAEIIERQDGRGHPVRLARRLKHTRFHPSKGQLDVTSHLPRLMDLKMECGQKRGYTPQQPKTSSFHQKNAYMLNQDHGDTHSRGRSEQRADHRGRDGGRQAPGDPEYHTIHKERYRQDEQRALELESCFPNCESRSELPNGWSRSSSQEYCTEEAPYRRSYPETDPLEMLHAEEIRNVRGRSPDYMSLHPDDDSLDWSPGRRQGSRERESTERSFPTEVVRHQSHDLSVNGKLSQNYKVGNLYNQEDKAGPSTTSLSNLRRNDDIPSFMSDMPEPFKRFLKSETNDSEQGKRKRKSHFSDASIQEVAKTRRMFEECGPSEPKFGSYRPPERLSPRSEMYEIQHSGHIQGQHQSENYDRGGEKGATEVVFDMLKNIKIDNKEEADFVKSKLCDLLKEFKAKKSYKAEKNFSRASISEEFNSLNPDDSLPTRRMYEQIPRENSDYRQQVENTSYHEDYRESVWQHRGHNIPEESHQEYNHSIPAYPSYLSSDLNHNKGISGEISSRQHGNHLSDAPSYPPVSLKPAYSQDDEEYLDFHSPAHSHHKERESMIERSGLYSSTLEKITLTLLELVKRQ